MTRLSLAAFLLVGMIAAAASSGFAQPKQPAVSPKTALGKKVTLARDRLPVGELLAKLSKDTGAKFVIDGPAFEQSGQEDFSLRIVEKVAVKDVLLSKVLTDTLKMVGAGYKAEKDHILVSPLKK